MGEFESKEQALARMERAQAFLRRQDAIDRVCENISNGGSIPAIAKVLDIYPSYLFRWLRADPYRNKRYEQALVDREEWEREVVLHQLRGIANFDIRDVLDDDGEILPPDKWPDTAAVAIQSMDRKERYSKDGEYLGADKSIKVIDKLKALELSGKQLAMFKDRVEHSGELTLEQLVLGMDRDHDEPHDDIPPEEEQH